MATLTPVGEDFLSTASQRYSKSWVIEQPAAAVWSELAGDKPLHWCRALDIDWTSTRPFGVGTTRRAKVLGGVLQVQEKFFLWDEGERYAFHGTDINLPLFRSLAEDYRVEPVDSGRCTFMWTIAFEPTTLGRLGGALNGPLFASFFNDTAKYFSTVSSDVR